MSSICKPWDICVPPMFFFFWRIMNRMLHTVLVITYSQNMLCQKKVWTTLYHKIKNKEPCAKVQTSIKKLFSDIFSFESWNCYKNQLSIRVKTSVPVLNYVEYKMDWCPKCKGGEQVSFVGNIHTFMRILFLSEQLWKLYKNSADKITEQESYKYTHKFPKINILVTWMCISIKIIIEYSLKKKEFMVANKLKCNTIQELKFTCWT